MSGWYTTPELSQANPDASLTATAQISSSLAASEIEMWDELGEVDDISDDAMKANTGN